MTRILRGLTMLPIVTSRTRNRAPTVPGHVTGAGSAPRLITESGLFYPFRAPGMASR
jgi:hypothetical protein